MQENTSPKVGDHTEKREEKHHSDEARWGCESKEDIVGELPYINNHHERRASMGNLREKAKTGSRKSSGIYPLVNLRSTITIGSHSLAKNRKCGGICPFSRASTPKEEETKFIPLSERLSGMKDPFENSWDKIKERVKGKSRYRRFETYDLRGVIFKANDDLRQELMVIQFIKRMKNIFISEGIAIFLYPYDITITSHNSGYIGTLIYIYIYTKI